MKVITSRVKDGHIEVHDSGLEEGMQVAILAPEAGEPVTLTASEQEELSSAMDEIRRGEHVDGTNLLAEIRARTVA